MSYCTLIMVIGEAPVVRVLGPDQRSSNMELNVDESGRLTCNLEAGGDNTEILWTRY